MNKLATYLTEQILLEEPTPIKKTIVVYSGRFQPFHKGHYATYSNLVKKFGKDNVFIGTSNKTDNQKSPFNFKEKKAIMTKMFGIPTNRIVEVKNPYAPTEILKNFNEDTTAFVTVVGEKDASRLGGKYFEKWNGTPTDSYRDKGYVYISPAQSNAVSGTDVRNWLSKGSDEEKRKNFLKAYPKFDETIYKFITLKLGKLSEIGMPGGVGVGLSFPNGTINGAPKPEDVKKIRKKLDKEDDVNEAIKWEESTYTKCMLGKLPLSLQIVKQLVDPIKTTSLHVTDVENLPKVAALEGTKKSISTFNKIDKYGKIAQGRGLHTKGGIIVALSGVVLAQSIMDLWTEPDKQGRRWANPGTVIANLGRVEDVVFNFAPELKPYKQRWKSFDETITNAEKAEFITKYIDAAYKFMLSKKKEFQDKYLNSNVLYYDSEWNEVVLSQIKIEKILAIPNNWGDDVTENEKTLKQLKQKYKNVEVAKNETDIQNFIKKNGGTIRESIKEEIKLDVKVGDTILMGKFKNHKVLVKSIGTDEHGMPTINGKKATTFRMYNKVNIYDEIVNEYSNLLDILEGSAEDDKYTHIGYGKYKLKGQEKNTDSPTFTKDDSGKYIASDTQKGTPKTDKPQGGAVRGAAMFKHDPNVKQKTEPITNKDWTVGKDGWELIDDKRSRVKNIRPYTDEELKGEVGEYFDNEETKNVAPNAFKDASDMISKMKSAKSVYLSSEQLQNMNNSDVGDILSASEEGGKDAMLKLGQERATDYGKDWNRLTKGIKSGANVPPPIVLKDKTGQLHLVAGNTRLMSFTANGKNLPVKVIEYDGEFQTDKTTQSQPNEKQHSISKNIQRKISGWAEKEKAFFTQGQDKPKSEARRSIGEALRDKAKGFGYAVKHGLQHETHLFKTAAKAVQKYVSMEDLTDEDKKALVDVAKKVVIASVLGVATGGLSHGVLPFAQHLAVEFVPHIVAETLLLGGAKAALFADTNEDERMLMGFMNKITDGIENMEIPNDVMEKAVDTYNEKKDVNEMSKSQLNQVEKYAEKQLSPEDIAFTNHFFDRVNDTRNGKEISEPELTGFFKRLARHKKEFKDFLEKYQQIVVKDKRNNINIPFVKQANHIIAKTVMRKDDFKSSNQTLTIEIAVQTDEIPGGKSQGKSLTDFTNKYNVSPEKIKQAIKDGAKVELEHTTDIRVATEIARDHIWEDLNYYIKLATIENENTIVEISAMGDAFSNDGNSTTGYAWNADWDDYDNQNYYLDNLEGWTNYIDNPSQYEKKRATDQALPIDNHGDGKTSKYNRILKYGFKEPVEFLKDADKKGISEAVVGNTIICDNCGWSWKIEDGGKDIYVCHKCGHDNQPNTNEAYTKGQLFAGNLKINGVVVPIEVELIGADNKKNAFITKVINIDKKYLSKLPSNGVLEIPARIFRFTGGWRKIKTPSVFEGMIMEGGAYGHMNHPFDTDINLTFGQLKDIVNRALDGNLELAREKTDGQALAISWVNGRLVAARNKSHLKNKGAGALDIAGVADKFSGRGELEKAYNFAMQDLTKAIKSLSDKQKEKIFKNGACFMNLEVIYPTSVNVIPYGQPLLVFHGTMEYDIDGNAIGEDAAAGKMLGGMIKQVEQHVQANYTLQGPPVLELPKSQQLSSKKGEFSAKISKLQKEFGLSDNDGVAEYHQGWWENYVDKKSPKTLDNKTKMGLVKRWAFGDKGFRIDKNNITDEKVLEWATKVDKEDQAKISKENLMKFEDIFLGLGAEVLSFTSSVLTVNPDKAVRDMKKRLDQTIKDVKKSGDPKKVEKLKLELRRLAAVGGTDKIVPLEGIVFVYNGKTFKLTGSFASLNQLLGIFYS